MKVNYQTRNGRLSVQLEGDSQKDIFAEISKFQEVFEEDVCGKCGSIAFNDRIRKKTFCPICESNEVYPIEISYAFKLLLNEMKALNIDPRVLLEDKA